MNKLYQTKKTEHTNKVMKAFFVRYLMILALLLGVAGTVMGQNYYYVFKYNTYYLYNNNGSPAAHTDFTKSNIWIASDALGNTSRTLQSYTQQTSNGYLRGGRNITFELGSTFNYWRTTNNNLYSYYDSRTRYVRYNNGAVECVNTNSNNFAATRIYIGHKNETNPSLNIDVVAGLTGSGIQLTPHIVGPYYSAYDSTDYNSTTYYWDSDHEASTSRPNEVTDWSDATITWTITTGGTYASVSSDGLVTITANPTGNVVVRMNVSKGGYSGNTSITLTRAFIDQNISTTATITSLSVTPSTKTLNYQENQEFTASATATARTSTTVAYTTLTGGGNTYYYYNGSLHDSAPTPQLSDPTPVTPTYSWTVTGAATGALSPTSGSGATINITHSNVSTAATANATLTVTASTPDASNQTATATITVPRTLPTEISTGVSSVDLCAGDNEVVAYYLTPSGVYDAVSVNSDNACVTASVDNAGALSLTAVSAGTAHVTLSASGPNSTTITKVVTVTVMSKCTTPSASFSNSDNKVTVSGTTGDNFYYTIDGTTPTDGSTAYSAAFTQATPATVKVIAYKAGSCPSDVYTLNVEQVETPTITIAASGVTFSCGTAGVTFYYNLSGGDPTTEWNGSAITAGLTDGNTIKVIAKKNGMINSDIATKVYHPASGVTADGKVIINDLQDHNWTYFAGVPTDVDGGSYNTSYNGTLYLPDPRNVKITYKANGGAVSIDESETEFVYLKTIEKVNGTYSYTVISNPFSKRPNGKGFGGWKIKEGADYISGYADEATLPLDAELTLTGLNTNYTANCISAEIELEATWVNLNNITYANNNTINYSVSGGNYETNILVLNRNVTGTITTTSPVTIMMVEPDGSADYRNTYSFTGNITPNNSGVTKIEFTKWNSTNTLNCNNHSVTVGRGMTTTSQCASYVTGVTGRTQNNGLTTYSVNLNYHLKIESGKFTDVSFIAGTAGTNGYVNCNGTSNQIKGTLGNDYDRAKGDDTKLDIVDEIYLGYRPTYASDNKNNANFTCWVKSGNLCSGTNVTNTTFNNSGSPTGGYYGEASQCFYVSSAGSQTNIGKRKLYVEGGTLAGIAGGIDSYNNSGDETFYLRMTGGTVRGVIYGSGAFAAASGNRRFIITGGTVKGWIAAGCNGTDPSQSGGTLPSDTYIYVGGNVHVGNETDLTLNTSTDGNIFGAGSGNSAQATTGQVNNSNVVIADECYVKRNVYGGGNYGYSNATATVYVTGGEVAGSVFGGSNQKQGVTVNVNMTGGQVDKGIYGGSNVTGTISQSVTMNINGGQVGTGTGSGQTANIHGGGYGSATRVTQNVELTLGKSGQTAPGVTVYGDVYGGSALGYVNGTAATNTYHTYVTLNKGIINGSLYGGALGDGSTAANVYGPVQVKVYGGSVRKTDANGANGSGGVYGCNNVNGAPQRAVSVDIYGTDPAPSAEEYALFAVYGGGNQASYSYGTPTVKVHNCDNSIEYVYGGGNAAHISNGNTDVTIYGGNKIGTVFGGGNGTVTAANVSGNTNVKIYGGTILRVFGGSNEQGSVGGSINVNVNKTGDTDPEGSASACDMIVGEVYGGGNKAASDVGNITIGCTGTLTGDHNDHPDNIGVTLEGIGSVYGGANQANISGDITLTMNSGIVGNLFGGNNTSGTISGGIQVDVEKDNGATCASYWYLGNVFGGGNLAQYSIPNDKALAVNILNGTVSGNVYGGGKGLDSDHTKGQVTGNPVVTIGDNNGSHQVTVSGDVYGGGDAGNVVGTPQVNVINKCNTNVANVYGGGNAADVSATDVNIDGGTIGMVFGGGHGDKNSLPQKEANVNGAVAVDVTGGTISKVFGGSNSKGTISGDVAVNIAKGNTSCQMHITQVYGGGNEANGNAGIITIGCTGDYETNGEGIVDVYGGANQADIGNSINLTVTGGHINRLFGGNNTSGNISGTIAVNVNWTTGVGACSHNYMGDVFGGGNLAAYSGSPSVTLTNGTVSGNIYGGGNEAGVGGSTVNINGGAMTAGKGIYGGCNTSGTVTGNIAVNINGGTLGTSGDGNALYGIFGGGYGASTATEGNVTVTIGDDGGTKVPTIYGDIYGGSALGSVNSDASDLTKIDFLNGTLHGNIYGGGLGDAGDASKGWVNGEVQVNISSESQAQSDCHIDLRAADIYGCNNTNGSPQADVTVHIWKTGYVTGNYSAQTGSLYAIDEVFGGGNQADYAPENGDVNSDKKATVYVHDCLNSIRRLFGGGNKAAATGIATTIDGGRFEYVFGGGNGEVGAADVGLGGTDLTVHSGRIAHLFGGSNTTGTISGPMLVNVDYEKMGVSGCDEQIDEFFGGGNEAVLGSVGNPINLNTTIGCHTIFGDVYGGSNLADIIGNVTLTINGGTIQNVYGGSKGSVGTAANITGNVKLNIYGGDIGNAFGGSNVNGNITGTIGVDLDWKDNGCSEKEIDNIYGGSNQAAYTPTNSTGTSPLVQLINGTVNVNVYGGGKGAAAIVTSNPKVIAGATGKNVVVLGNIFGGGDAAQVTGSTDVSVIHSAIVGSSSGSEGNIFGGGNAAVVTGDTKVYLGNRAKIYGNVYGGGNQGEVNGDTKVIVNSD